jgi:SAM-dependent methyltransferase
MNHFIHGVARAAIETFDLPEPILEIGSYQVPGQEEIADLRPLLSPKSHVGVDIRSGPGVDCVASVEQLPQKTASVGTVLALNTFEHVARFWRGFDEVYRVLRPDGVLLVSCPFYFHIHNHPSDYWRFTPEALDVLLQNYPTRILGWQGNAKKPLHVWAVAFREDHPPLTSGQIDLYRQKLSTYARQPLSAVQKIRYGLGRLLCGRRPFVPYLDQEKWEIVCQPPLLPESKPAATRKTAEPALR